MLAKINARSGYNVLWNKTKFISHNRIAKGSFCICSVYTDIDKDVTIDTSETLVPGSVCLILGTSEDE